MQRGQSVRLMFRKAMFKTDKFLQYACGFGEYIHCEIYIPTMKCGNEVGFTFTNFSGDSMKLRSDIKNSYYNSPALYTFFEVFMNDAEYDQFISQNMSLVQRGVPYNYADCVFMALPMGLRKVFIQDSLPAATIAKATGALGNGHNAATQVRARPEINKKVCEDKLEHVTSLFCSQSIILTLRVALQKDHVLFPLVTEATARCTSPNEFFVSLKSLIGPEQTLPA
jgi:hypothetical protein